MGRGRGVGGGGAVRVAETDGDNNPTPSPARQSPIRPPTHCKHSTSILHLALVTGCFAGRVSTPTANIMYATDSVTLHAGLRKHYVYVM